ncbi:hypothetical protein I4U23_010402 [Adineta vaga]|nr:hypothetical protein I4U23_010402 [Adineta vaga]
MGNVNFFKSKICVKNEMISSNLSSDETLSDGITLVWLDSNAEKYSYDETKKTLSCFRRLNVTSVRSYSNVNSCLTFFQSISYDENTSSAKIYLIVSGKFSSEILPQLNSYPMVDSVFIFCLNETNYKYLIEKYQPIVNGIYIDDETLCQSINKRLDRLNQSTLVFQFFSQEQNTTRNLTKDAASFLWFQLFKIILIDLKCTENERDLMLKKCSAQMQKDVKLRDMLKELEVFRRTYRSDHAIYWYTKETFLYILLNTALRTEDMDGLYIFQYFLADLCRQLKIEHRKLYEKYSHSPILTLYRGGLIPNEEFEKLQELIGDLISLNGFISTSKQRWVATKFAKRKRSNQQKTTNVLFIIKVDLRCQSIICADVTEMSAQKEEEEVLFDIGTVFYLNQVVFDDDENIWNVHLTATEDGRTAVKDYIKLIQQEVTDHSVSIVFGQLLLQMGNYLKAQEYFLNLFETFNHDHPDIPSIQYHLGLTYGYQEDFQKAEDCLIDVYQYLVHMDSNNLHLARVKNALGWIYHQTGELSAATESYNHALIFADEQLHLINAQTHSLMGDLSLEKHMFIEAEKSYKQALNIEYQYLPRGHPRIGVTLNDLGDVFRKKLEMNTAMTYYEQAQAIFQENLPIYHPFTAYCWSCMGFVYLFKQNIDKAKEYHTKALKTYRRTLPSDHTNIKISEINLDCTEFCKLNDTYVKICTRF